MVKLTVSFNDGSVESFDLTQEELIIADFTYFTSLIEVARQALADKYGWNVEGIIGINIELV